MPKRKQPNQKPLTIDMGFEEALERFASVNADELPDNVRLRRSQPKKREGEPGSKRQGESK